MVLKSGGVSLAGSVGEQPTSTWDSPHPETMSVNAQETPGRRRGCPTTAPQSVSRGRNCFSPVTALGWP